MWGAPVCRGCTSPRGQGPLQLFSKVAVLLHEKCAAAAESLPAPARRLLYIHGNGSLEKWGSGRGASLGGGGDEVVWAHRVALDSGCREFGSFNPNKPHNTHTSKA